MEKKLYIKSYGCQMNVYDSERMASVLKPLGYQLTSEVDEADMVILNTCHVREKATEKVYSELGRLKPLKEIKKDKGEEMIVAVAGCTAQAEGEEIIRRVPYVDMVFGPQTYHRLPRMIAEVAREKDHRKGPGRGIVDVDFPVESKFDYLPEVENPQGVSAFLSIQEGCDKFCHFCVVPYTRGAEYSRPASDILSEAKLLVSKGVREITLLGQNVNAYHGEGLDGKAWSLGRLIYALAEIEDLHRIRYTTSHPRDVNEEQIQAHREIPKLMPYFHLPVQSGSDKILENMNRKHTVSFYKEIIERFREARPDIAFSSDFIVGYPGETEKDFEKTLQLVRDINYASSFSFSYSPRPGTPASVLEDQVPEEVKSERLQILQALLRDQQIAFNQSLVGQVLPVLFEKEGRHEGQLIGRSPYLQSVFATIPKHLIGCTLEVKIKSVSQNSLAGEVVTGDFESDPLEIIGKVA